MMIRRLIAAAALLGAASLTLPTYAQQIIRLTAVSGHPPVFLWVKLMDEFFVPEVDRRLAANGKYKIEWTKAWGGTLAKLGSESKAISDGVADLGLVSTVFETAKFPMQNVSYFTPFSTDDIATVTQIVDDLQKSIPAMGNSWTKNGLVYLGGAALDTYHIWTTFPLRSIDDLNGKKIIAPGPAANWIGGTGAIAVSGNLNTYYEDIKSGVASGTITFATGAWSAKVHEVAPYISKVNFGAQFATGMAINKNRFDALAPEVQQILLEVGAEYQKRFAVAQTETAQALLKKAEEAGAKISELSDKERKRWADALSPLGQIWAADLEKKGMPGNQILSDYMTSLKNVGVQVPRDWANQ